MANFETVFEDAKDLYVSSVVFYANTNKLYVEAAHTTEVDHDTLLDLCMKGVVLIYDTDTYYRPTSFKESSGTLTISYGTSKSVTSTKA